MPLTDCLLCSYEVEYNLVIRLKSAMMECIFRPIPCIIYPDSAKTPSHPKSFQISRGQTPMFSEAVDLQSSNQCTLDGGQRLGSAPDLANCQPVRRQQRSPLLLGPLHPANGKHTNVRDGIVDPDVTVRQHPISHQQLAVRLALQERDQLLQDPADVAVISIVRDVPEVVDIRALDRLRREYVVRHELDAGRRHHAFERHGQVLDDDAASELWVQLAHAVHDVSPAAGDVDDGDVRVLDVVLGELVTERVRRDARGRGPHAVDHVPRPLRVRLEKVPEALAAVGPLVRRARLLGGRLVAPGR